MFVTTVLAWVVIESLTTKSETGVKVSIPGQVLESGDRVLVQLMAVDAGMVLPVSVALAEPTVSDVLMSKSFSKSSISATVGSTTCTSKPKPVTVVLAGMVLKLK